MYLFLSLVMLILGSYKSSGCGLVWCGVVWCGVVWCGFTYLYVFRGVGVTREGYEETVRMSPIPSGPFRLTSSWFFRITLKGGIFNSK